MITKIVLENFMAHERTELELGPGVNALTGPNNAGKSAIVEAIRCVATNPVPRHYIRHGAKEARVSLEFANGSKVVWIRKKRSSGYELWTPGDDEPAEYWKFGRRPPEDILKVLKLDLVELETGTEVDVHVGNQREPVFLLNQPGSNAAAFFAASTESAHLLAMQNLLKRKTQDAGREKRSLQDRIQDIESELDAFATLPMIEVGLETARELEDSTKQLQSEIPQLEKHILDLENGQVLASGLTSTATVLNTIEKTPKLYDTSKLAGLQETSSVVRSALDNARESSRVLTVLDPVPVIHDTRHLSIIRNQLQSMESMLGTARKENAIVQAASAPPECEELRHLSEIMDEMIVCRTRLQRGARRQAVLEGIAEPPAMVSVEKMGSLLADIWNTEQAANKVKGDLAALETQLQSLADAITRRLDALGRCPTCGGDINSVAFLDRRHCDDA